MTRLGIGLALLLLGGTGCDGCRKDAEGAPDASEMMADAIGPETDGGTVVEARVREPVVDAAAHLDPIDPACADNVDLERALGDARCATNAATAKSLRAAVEAEGKAPLAQEAKIEGDRVVLRLVNKGQKPLVLPLSFHADVPSFSMLLEAVDTRALYEMEPTTIAPVDAGTAARFARIRLAPGAAATVKVGLPKKIMKRIAPACEAGTCAPEKPSPGTYKLHVGQLISDVESGLPASLDWTVK